MDQLLKRVADKVQGITQTQHQTPDTAQRPAGQTGSGAATPTGSGSSDLGKSRLPLPDVVLQAIDKYVDGERLTLWRESNLRALDLTPRSFFPLKVLHPKSRRSSQRKAKPSKRKHSIPSKRTSRRLSVACSKATFLLFIRIVN